MYNNSILSLRCFTLSVPSLLINCFCFRDTFSPLSWLFRRSLSLLKTSCSMLITLWENHAPFQHILEAFAMLSTTPPIVNITGSLLCVDNLLYVLHVLPGFSHFPDFPRYFIYSMHYCGVIPSS